MAVIKSFSNHRMHLDKRASQFKVNNFKRLFDLAPIAWMRNKLFAILLACLLTRSRGNGILVLHNAFFVRYIKKLMINITIGKEQFLIEHNRLSPVNLQATFALLTRFQQERKPLLKDTEWSFKLRVPFIIWLGSLPLEKIPHLRKSKKQIFKNYPETKY